MEFRFETKMGCFIIICILHIVIPSHIFSTYSDTRFIVERSPHSHIQCYAFISIILMNIFNSSCFFHQNSCNSCSFLLFHFLLSILLSYYIYHRPPLLVTFSPFLQNQCKMLLQKGKKSHSDIILEQLVRSVAGNIVVSRTSDYICISLANILDLPTFCIGNVEKIKNL